MSAPALGVVSQNLKGASFKGPMLILCDACEKLEGLPETVHTHCVVNPNFNRRFSASASENSS